MPERKPRTKAPKGEQLGGDLQGDLALYEKTGLLQHSLNAKTAYRYHGCLLHYQEALQGAPPTLDSSKAFLGHLRAQGYSAATLRTFAAVLKGFHEWRNEKLDFKVKVPKHNPVYIERSIVLKMLELAKPSPRDYLVLLLLYLAGMRRDEVVKLKVGNVGEKALRFRGKEDKDRTVPLGPTLKAAIKPFCEGKKPHDAVLGCGEKAVYMTVKKYGRLAGKPDFKPHDLRHAFATHLMDLGVNLRAIQELLGHADLGTTQIYTAVSGAHLEKAINALDPFAGTGTTEIANSSRSRKDEPSETKQLAESSHKQALRQVAQIVADTLDFPSPWDLLRSGDFDLEFRSGKYPLPLGMAVIDDHGQVKVSFHDIGTGVAEPHLIKGLWSHLATSALSRYTELAGDDGKVRNLRVKSGEYSQAMLEFLKLITDEIRPQKVRLYLHAEEKPGLTRMFPITIWNDAIQKAEGHPWIHGLWYKHQGITETGLSRLNCGGFTLGIAENENTLKNYEKLHKELRAKYARHPSVKGIYTKNLELSNLFQEVRQELKEFSDVENIPGHCDLC
jgi:integrase/recombinase XerD